MNTEYINLVLPLDADRYNPKTNRDNLVKIDTSIKGIDLSKADGLVFQNNILQLTAKGTPIGNPIVIAGGSGDGINAFITGYETGSHLFSADNTLNFTISNWNINKVALLIYNNMLLNQNDDYTIDSNGKVTLLISTEGRQSIFWILLTTGFDYTNLINTPVIVNNYDGGLDKIASAELVKSTKTLIDNHTLLHAPVDAQKNSDITKNEIEAKLTGNILSHTHDYEPANSNIQMHVANKEHINIDTLGNINPNGIYRSIASIYRVAKLLGTDKHVNMTDYGQLLTLNADNSNTYLQIYAGMAKDKGLFYRNGLTTETQPFNMLYSTQNITISDSAPTGVLQVGHIHMTY